MHRKKEMKRRGRPIRRGDIYYADLNPTVGSEQNGIRPVVIVQGNIGNRYSPTVIVAATTGRTNKRKLPTHVQIEVCSNMPKKDTTILLEQLGTLDRSRLREYVGHLDYAAIQNWSCTKTVEYDIICQKRQMKTDGNDKGEMSSV